MIIIFACAFRYTLPFARLLLLFLTAEKEIQTFITWCLSKNKHKNRVCKQKVNDLFYSERRSNLQGRVWFIMQAFQAEDFFVRARSTKETRTHRR
jgi:hypothetical protein